MLNTQSNTPFRLHTHTTHTHVHMHDRGMRSGTLPHPIVVGIGAACELAGQEMDYDRQHIHALSQRLINGITSQLDHVIRNGDPEQSYDGMLKRRITGYCEMIYLFCNPGVVNLSFAFVEGESLLMAMKDIALSSGR